MKFDTRHFPRSLVCSSPAFAAASRAKPSLIEQTAILQGNAPACRLLSGAVLLFSALMLALPGVVQSQSIDPRTLPGANPATTQDNALHTAGSNSTIHPIRGFLPDLDFELMAAGGATITEKDFSGKVVMMFFGYASCPDICPTTMAQLSEVIRLLGPEAEDKVRIVFISVDPHRDTPEILQAYVDAFDSQAIGLTGSEKQISQLARRYRVAYQIEKPRGDDTEVYEVAHSRGIYIFDDRGKARLLASDSEATDKLAAAVKDLIPES